MPDIRHTMTIEATPQQIWPALTTAEGVGGWWTLGDAMLTGEFGAPGEFSFQSRDVTSRIEVTVLDPPAHVAWRAIESNAPGGWAGTTITVDLTAEGDGARLDFAHRGFAEDNEGYRRVVAGWAHYLQNLKRAIETESGTRAADLPTGQRRTS